MGNWTRTNRLCRPRRANPTRAQLLPSFLLVQPARKRVETYGSLTGDRELRFEQVFQQPHPSADVGAREDGSRSFLVVGDWGRGGGYGQGDVALAMAQVAE